MRLPPELGPVPPPPPDPPPPPPPPPALSLVSPKLGPSAASSICSFMLLSELTTRRTARFNLWNASVVVLSLSVSLASIDDTVLRKSCVACCIWLAASELGAAGCVFPVSPGLIPCFCAA